MGHQGSVERKVQAIEYLDEKVIGPVVEKMEAAGEDFRLLILPDHPTPVRLRTHTSDDVPYLLYDSTHPLDKGWHYNEEEGRKSGIRIEQGHLLMDKFLDEE